MTKEEIMELAESVRLADNGLITNGDYTEELVKFFRLAYARGMLKQEKQFMQLFLDPENQPTQFGTATQEYRDQEILEEREACARVSFLHDITPWKYDMGHVRIAQIVSIEIGKAIRARAQAERGET